MTTADYVDVETVARHFGVTGETVRDWIRTKRLDADTTPTGRYRIPRLAFERLIEKKKSQDSQDSQIGNA